MGRALSTLLSYPYCQPSYPPDTPLLYILPNLILSTHLSGTYWPSSCPCTPLLHIWPIVILSTYWPLPYLPHASPTHTACRHTLRTSLLHILPAIMPFKCLYCPQSCPPHSSLAHPGHRPTFYPPPLDILLSFPRHSTTAHMDHHPTLHNHLIHILSTKQFLSIAGHILNLDGMGTLLLVLFNGRGKYLCCQGETINLLLSFSNVP